MKRKRVVAVFLVLMFCITLFPMTALAEQQYTPELFNEIKRYLDERYYQEPSQDELYKGAIEGMLKSLDDPYTAYFTEEEYNKFYDNINPSITGIGIQMEKCDEGVVVLTVFPGTPAQEVGLQTGDVIVSVDGVDIKDMKAVDAANRIKGDEGTKVTIGVKKKGTDKITSMALTRRKFEIPQVRSEMLTDDVGYIRLMTFGDNTLIEFSDEIDKLQAEGMKKLVLDLRGNPGGYLQGALDVAEYFIDGPGVLVKGRDAESYKPYRGRFPLRNLDIPVVVLVDRGSASASEILTGALKDHGFTVIGTRTYGKGVIQQVVKLENGGYLKYTIASFYSPIKKNPIHGIGIKPDILLSDPGLQLVRAVAELNGGEGLSVEVDLDHNTVSAGKIKAAMPNTIIKERGEYYLPLRYMTELFGGRIIWDEKLGKSRLTLRDKEFVVNNALGTVSENYKYIGRRQDVKTVKGVTYISLDFIKRYFPLNVKVEGENLHISTR